MSSKSHLPIIFTVVRHALHSGKECIAVKKGLCGFCSEHGPEEALEDPEEAMPVFENAPLNPLQGRSPVAPAEGHQEEETGEGLPAHGGAPIRICILPLPSTCLGGWSSHALVHICMKCCNSSDTLTCAAWAPWGLLQL